MAEKGSQGSGNRNEPKNNAKDSGKIDSAESTKAILEKNLEKMETLLKHSTSGIHILFENQAIASALSNSGDDKDFLDFTKMKQVQDCMTALISKKTYFDKMDYLSQLDQDSYQMLIRTYFHIVENTVRASSDHPH